MSPPALQAWHQALRSSDLEAMRSLLADEVVFHSPLLHRPLQASAITLHYLGAAPQVFAGPGLRCVPEVIGAEDAVLEFELELDDIHINGVDMLRWNAQHQITDFKLMLRPMKALAGIQQKMAAQLHAE